MLKVIKEDPYILFLEGPGFARQAWACTICYGKGRSYIQGNAYAGCARHISSKGHTDAVAGAAAAAAVGTADDVEEQRE